MFILKLCDIKENQSAEIVSVDSSSLSLRRLSDLGFCVGEKVSCTHINPLGSPIAYRVRGSQVALRKKDAAGIGVIR